jgi:hypothetical protein
MTVMDAGHLVAGASKPGGPGEFKDIYNDDGTFSSEKVARIYEASKNWPPERKSAALTWLKSAVKREDIKRRYASAAEIAHSVDPDFIITPAIDLISTAVETVLAAPRRNLLITMPPQEGKSTLCCVYTPIRAWQLNPNLRIIVCTYGDDLALQHSGNCRKVIEEHGTDVVDKLTGATVEDKLGLKISSKSRRQDAWKIDGGNGGLVAAGLGSAITGRPADLMIIDDPFKNMMEADSETHRKKVDEWMSTVALTRLSPQASVILIQTRWHKEDLAGKVMEGERALDKEFRSWRHINIPAISEKGIFDSLNREPGVSMVSARGRTKQEFEQTKRKVGERTWYAMYQGTPRNPEGGLFQDGWFLPRIPLDDPLLLHPVFAVVAVDPADSGEGDETGILAGIVSNNGTSIFTDDRSGLMTSAEWSREAVLLALETGAREIVLEGYSTWKTYSLVVKHAWEAIQKEAGEKLAKGEALTGIELRALNPNMPFVISKYTEAGDPEGRASLLRTRVERRSTRVVDTKLRGFEEQACDWLTGQHCPDRVSAAVILDWRLDQLGSGRMTMASPLHERGQNTLPERYTRTIGGRNLPGQANGMYPRFLRGDKPY